MSDEQNPPQGQTTDQTPTPSEGDRKPRPFGLVVAIALILIIVIFLIAVTGSQKEDFSALVAGLQRLMGGH